MYEGKNKEEAINKAVNEAKEYEEADKKRKEVVDNHNKLDGFIFTVEKSVKDLGDKLDASDKETIENAVKDAKTELESNDNDRMVKALETLNNVVQPIFTKVYQANGGNPNDMGGTGAEGGNGPDAEFHQN